jgi:hypothetical protein
MQNKNSKISLRAKSDYHYVSGNLVATAEFKLMTDGSMLSTWVVTGVGTNGALACLFMGRFGLVARDEADAVAESESIAPIVLELANRGTGLNGLANVNLSEHVLTAVLMFHIDMQLKLSESRQEIASLAKRAARGFELCKSFGYSKYIELLSDIESVPVSTIKRRLDSARDAGLIPKQRGRNAKTD